MRQVVVQIQCDLCGADVPEPDVEVVQWSLGAAGYELDLGPECAGKLRTTTVGDLAELSRPAEPSRNGKAKRAYKPRGTPDPYEVYKRADGRYRCPMCQRDYGSAGSLRGHARKAHGLYSAALHATATS